LLQVEEQAVQTEMVQVAEVLAVIVAQFLVKHQVVEHPQNL